MRGQRAPRLFQSMLSVPISRISGRGGSDTRIWDMYVEFAGLWISQDMHPIRELPKLEPITYPKFNKVQFWKRSVYSLSYFGDEVGLGLVADTSTADETPSQIKARLAALSAFAESQGLTGPAVFDGLRRLRSDIQTQLLDMRRFTLFYRFVFFMCREQGQKSISVSTAIDAWRLSLTGRFRLLDQWCAFVQVHQQHAISEDTWHQVLEFSRNVHEDLSNYDREGAWPVLVDDFVDNMYRKFACSRYSTRKNNHCDFGLNTIADVSSNDPSVAHISPSWLAPQPGILVAAGSKRRREDLKDEPAQADSINCIALRLAEIPSRLSSKRVCRTAMVLELLDPMEVIDADVQEVSGLWQHFNQKQM